MQKPTENSTLALGAVVTLVSFAAEKAFHVTLTQDVLLALPLALGAVPHALTYLVDLLRVRKDEAVLAQAAADAKAAQVAADAAAAQHAQFLEAVKQAAIELAAQGNADKPAGA